MLVAIPTYNEVENVGPLSRAVLSAVETADLLFIDDDSPDGTARAIRALAEHEDRILLAARPGRLGLSSAYCLAFRRALHHRYDALVTMDADFSHDPASLPQLLEGLETSDIAIGSRYVSAGGVRSWPLHRRLLSKVANRLARWLLALGTNDCTSGFRAYRSAALALLPIDHIRASSYSFAIEMSFLAHRYRLRILEIPIIFTQRRQGRSKLSAARGLRAFLTLLRLAGPFTEHPPSNPSPARR